VIASADASGGSGGQTRPEETWRLGELTPDEAAVIAGWRYGGRYAFYDTEADPEFAAELADPSLWRLRDLEAERDVLLAVRDEGGALAGFFSFRGSPALCVTGLGLAPELTGRALGLGFVRAGLGFARRQWRVSRFHLEVVAFNLRALTVYARLGFVPAGRFWRAAPELGGRVVEWVTLEAAGEEPWPIGNSESREDDDA
jgi:[ribosomal protein S18]-alanine N-acetyltransferase